MGLVCSGRDAGLESDPFRLLAFGCFLPFGDDDGVCPDAAALDFAIPIPTPGGLVTHPHLFSLIGTFHAFRLPQPDNRCPGLWKMIGISYERSQYRVAPECCSLSLRQAASPPRERRAILQLCDATRYKASAALLVRLLSTTCLGRNSSGRRCSSSGVLSRPTLITP